jgi:histidinol-phosphatase (PHP family)
MYPARELLELLVAAGKPVALSSDAHEPESIGHGYDRALELLRDVGVQRLCVFNKRVRREEPLG